MLTVILNDNPLTLPQKMSLQELLQHLKIENSAFAVAINRTFVAKLEYATTFLNEQDCIEIVAPMQGG